MMSMEHRLDQRQKQTLGQRIMLTQKMQQSIQILQLSAAELEQHIQQELETNPVLEVVEREPVLEPVPPAASTDAPDEFEEAFDLDTFARDWEYDIRNREGQDLSRNPDLDERRRYYENSITREESFSSRLLTQLRMAADDETTLRIGECIIGDINDRGYFTGSLEEIAADTGVPVEQVEDVLRLVQSFEPIGVGARDIVECLLIQIAVEYPDEPQLRELVEFHLEELERRQIPKIAKAMNISVERVEELKAMLAKLNPWPGSAGDLPQYVIPDVIVEKVDGAFVVYPGDDHLPGLRISAEYRQMASNAKMDPQGKQYLREKVDSAKWLLRNIEQRQNTIVRIARAIVDVQEEFLEKGPEFLKPLTLQEIADTVGVHEATVSRATRGKYMQTPQGLYEMKYFFSPGLRRDSGESQSSKSVQSIIKKIIDEEDKSRPLSDQKIADMLRRQGLNIARRTVTKYRESLGILTTTLRKKYE
ncbi:MAG TPA: RNA polymerase factor sigma-54 [Candidatus Hydrogenedentes bacterium]|nr:RNA polymerase factor sigma-54 [Candidatus Hydrogenedentota bacterium]HOV74013.1 RNA polymerase factor sigma-54 [Candidatus Hydrogenedentota bacterium]HPC16001.1 RNA polymerase factor sigma-54 [Candidatus Hydrogenedentota bacterium]HRT19955.1 RNA polymerase factor sigma-54 [Candidatus Hydrogenedentota bacterium]HRT64633.1 RNA polymerase factor sigma-54 [Candidatus Hydrogenedentota bacterium]